MLCFGSSLSLRSVARFGSALSVLGYAHLGSSVSLRGLARCGSSMAVLDFLHLASTLSMRRMGRLASSFSVLGCARLGATISILDFGRMGSSMSILDFVHFGSSVSLRSVNRVGSAVSVLGVAWLGAALALRGWVRLASTVSVLGDLNLGSTLSLRNVCRFGQHISMHEQIKFGKADTYIVYTSSQDLIEFYMNTYRTMSIGYVGTTGGGSLHGVWYADHMVHTSDRRLKTNIRPLIKSLTQASGEATGVPAEDGAAWVLRELRPVSFRFKYGAEAKLERYGFIADEVQRAIPAVVRESPATGVKGIAYQDLLAVFAAALQSMERRVEGSGVRTREHDSRLAALEEKLQRIEEAVARQTDAMDARLRAVEAAVRP